MRSFPRLALSTVPVDVTSSSLLNFATRSSSSNWHRMIWALLYLPLWSVTVPSSWTRGPGPLPGRLPRAFHAGPDGVFLVGSGERPRQVAGLGHFGQAVRGGWSGLLPVPARSRPFPPVPAWPVPRCYDRVFRFLYRRPAALFRKIAARAMVRSRLSRQDAEYRLEAFRLTMKPLPASRRQRPETCLTGIHHGGA